MDKKKHKPSRHTTQHITASHYGNEVGHKTAYGYTFDERFFTAASKTLKEGSVYHVKNDRCDENDPCKEIDVLITDKIPPHTHRNLDLSDGAFKQLANLKQGLMKVSLTYKGNVEHDPALYHHWERQPGNHVAPDTLEGLKLHTVRHKHHR